MRSLKETRVYVDSMTLNRSSFKVLSELRQPAYRDQLLRCSLSIPSNIAEGFYRNTPGDFIRFLRYARGSAGEFMTQMECAIENGLIDREIGSKFIADADSISAQLFKLIEYLRSPK